MARYLSPEWFEEADEAARCSALLGESTRGAAVTLQQVVTGTPGGEVRYWVRVDHGDVRVAAGEAPRADATVTQSYETAVAVSTGRLGVEAAFLAGRVHVTGNLALIVEHGRALETLHHAFADLRRRTDYE